MNFSNLIDWSFFWSVFQNIFFSVSPFALIPVAIMCVGLVLLVVITAVKAARSK